MLFSKKVSAETAFGPGPTAKEKADKVAEQNKRIQELKDSARKLVASEAFKEFKAQYVTGREALIDIFKGLEATDHATMIKVQSHIELFDELLAYEKKAE